MLWRRVGVLGLVLVACGGGDGSVELDGGSNGSVDSGAVNPVDAAAAVDAIGDAAAPGDASSDATAPGDAILDAAWIDAAPEGNPGFQVPTIVTRAYSEAGGSWEDQGEADWSCLGTPSGDQLSTVEIVLSGTVRDFQTANLVSDATTAVYSGANIADPLDSSISDAGGGLSLTLPVGVARVGFEITGEGVFHTLVFHEYFDPSQPSQDHDWAAVSVLTANVLPAFVGITRTPGRGMALGQLLDCNGDHVSGAVVTVSSSAGSVAHVSGAATYYFSAGSTSLPVRWTQQPSTNKDGRFMVIEMEPEPTAYLQAWGFVSGQWPGSDPMTLLAEVPIVVVGDGVAVTDLEPLRSD